MLKKLIKKLLTPIVREVIEEWEQKIVQKTLPVITHYDDDEATKIALQQIRNSRKLRLTQEDLRRYTDR